MNQYVLLGFMKSVSDNAVPDISSTEGYMQNAWTNFTMLTSWMSNTTILTIGGENITFMGLMLYVALFNIACYFVNKIFWGDD